MNCGCKVYSQTMGLLPLNCSTQEKKHTYSQTQIQLGFQLKIAWRGREGKGGEGRGREGKGGEGRGREGRGGEGRGGEGGRERRRGGGRERRRGGGRG